MDSLPQPVAHAASDWMRAITETELALIPNGGPNAGRRDRCRSLYSIPLFTAEQIRDAIEQDREACISAILSKAYGEADDNETHAYNAALEHAAAAIRARSEQGKLSTSMDV
jgi:hypothetical protein